MSDEAADRHQIRELIENWALWRDGRDWARFRTVWHDDAVNAAWFPGGAHAFIKGQSRHARPRPRRPGTRRALRARRAPAQGGPLQRAAL
jgi:SnoaL-like domain